MSPKLIDRLLVLTAAAIVLFVCCGFASASPQSDVEVAVAIVQARGVTAAALPLPFGPAAENAGSFTDDLAAIRDELEAQRELLQGLQQQPAASPVAAYPNGLYFYCDETWCPGCPRAKKEMAAAWPALQKAGWKRGFSRGKPLEGVNITMVYAIDPDDPPQMLLAMLGEDWQLPALVYWESGAVVRAWVPECERPLDQWTVGWLATGKDLRPIKPMLQSGGLYPTRSGWWSVEGTWNASRDYVLSHLTNGGPQGQHTTSVSGQRVSKFDTAWLNALSRAELHAVHSDDHEGRVNKRYAVLHGQFGAEGYPPPRAATAAVRPRPAATPPRPVAAPRQYQSTCPHCPNYRPARR